MFPPPFSFVYSPVFTYLCIISHQCNAYENNFKENLGFHDILIHQEASNLVNSLLPEHATSVKVWDNMALLQSWSHQQRFDWSEIFEWLTDRNCELIRFLYFMSHQIQSISFFSKFLYSCIQQTKYIVVIDSKIKWVIMWLFPSIT